MDDGKDLDEENYYDVCTLELNEEHLN